MDTDGTERTCSLPTAFGVCDFQCKGEFYDVDGKTTTAAGGRFAIQDTTLTAVAVALPNAFNTDLGVTGNPSNIVSQVYGDNRVHTAAPTARPNGREDWYQHRHRRRLRQQRRHRLSRHHQLSRRQHVRGLLVSIGDFRTPTVCR